MIGQNTVDLFGHGPVEGTHSRFDMRDGNQQLRRGQGGSEGGVGIAEDDDHSGPGVAQDLLDRLQHPAGLGAMRGGADLQVEIGAGRLRPSKNVCDIAQA